MTIFFRSGGGQGEDTEFLRDGLSTRWVFCGLHVVRLSKSILALDIKNFMSRVDELRKQINNHRRRLQILKEQQALQGLSVDPKIPLEIEDIETKITALKVELQDVQEADENTVESSNNQTKNNSNLDEKVHKRYTEVTNIFIAVLGVIVAIFACIAAWLALPQIQETLQKKERVELNNTQQITPSVTAINGVLLPTQTTSQIDTPSLLKTATSTSTPISTSSIENTPTSMPTSTSISGTIATIQPSECKARIVSPFPDQKVAYNLYQTPRIDADKIGSLDTGTIVNIGEKLDGPEIWYKLLDDNYVVLGWTREENVYLLGLCSSN